jgi:glutaredoxin
LDTQVLGVSVDPLPTLKAWAESLGGIHYPLLSDFYPHGAIAARYGVLREEGNSERALFVVDKRGIVRYIDIHDIDEAPDNDVVLAELRRIDPVAAAHAAPGPEPGLPAVPADHVIMYCTSWCPGCRRARRLFEQYDVPYTEIDINKVPAARDRLRILTGGTLTTPTFEVKGEVIVDYRFDQRERLEQLLGINKSAEL